MYKDPYGYIEIEKISNIGKSMEVLYIPDFKWKIETNNQLYILLQKAIERKTHVLKEGESSNITEKIILLLYDAYIYADFEDVIKMFEKVRNYKLFHSIFWVSSRNITPRKVLLLYSEKKDWNYNSNSGDQFNSFR